MSTESLSQRNKGDEVLESDKQLENVESAELTIPNSELTQEQSTDTLRAQTINAGNQSQETKGKKKKPPAETCQICRIDLSRQRPYYQRYKICRNCAAVESIFLDGITQRFCQQCGKFENIALFDGTTKTCRRRLKRHAERRRRWVKITIKDKEANEKKIVSIGGTTIDVSNMSDIVAASCGIQPFISSRVNNVNTEGHMAAQATDVEMGHTVHDRGVKSASVGMHVPYVLPCIAPAQPLSQDTFIQQHSQQQQHFVPPLPQQQQQQQQQHRLATHSVYPPLRPQTHVMEPHYHGQEQQQQHIMPMIGVNPRLLSWIQTNHASRVYYPRPRRATWGIQELANAPNSNSSSTFVANSSYAATGMAGGGGIGILNAPLQHSQLVDNVAPSHSALHALPDKPGFDHQSMFAVASAAAAAYRNAQSGISNEPKGN